MKLHKFILPVIITATAVFSGCEKTSEQQRVNYVFNENDLLVYEVLMSHCFLVVHHKQIKNNEPQTIKIRLLDSETKKDITNGEVYLTIANKGRRKKIDINQTAPGLFLGIVDINFSGLSSFNFEVVTDDFTNTSVVEHQVIHQ
jgi:hypothetical protein